MPDLARIRTWIFDLDNTLYPPEARLFDQIAERMTGWIMHALDMDRAAADRLRQAYWRRYGATLTGLVAEHGLAPGPCLAHVHDIDLGALRPDPALARRIARLPGRRIVFTNGAGAPYAARVLAARGLAGAFDAVYGMEHTGFASKPDRAAFDAVIRAEGIDPARAAMFEDTAANLRVPHRLGMATIHVAPRRAPGAHVHHHAHDLRAFLSQIG